MFANSDWRGAHHDPANFAVLVRVKFSCAVFFALLAL